MLLRPAAVPKPRRDKHHSATASEVDQKRRRQHEPRGDGRRCRKSTREITIKRAGPRVLPAFVEEQLDDLTLASQSGCAIIRADHARQSRRWEAIHTNRLTAVSADRHCVAGIVFETFHFSRRYVAGFAFKMRSSPWRSTSPVISTGSATRSNTCLFTGLPSAETSSR